MRFGRQFLDNLRARVNISSVVGAYVNLKHKGRGEFTGLCPFHQEKTPSFTVSDNKGFYHCFGCGAHGDIVGFMMEHRGLPYPEAVKELALQAGMELPKQEAYDAVREKKIEDSYEVLELATKWFENNLNSQAGMEARLYLKDRGLTPETIKKFRLGFAPDEWESLKNYLKNNNVDEDMILANGLVTSNEDGSKKYDRFRGRIIFPIFNSTGKVIAFGGRTMAKDKEQGPKYLNSPETDLFKKGYTLYGFNFAKDKAYKESTIMAVEGYMDVIALHQAGFGYAVAPLGTALTENHIKQMWKVTKEPILCMDGDEAGQRASKKFAEEYIALLEPGYTIKFAFVPKGYDPDEYVKQQGSAAFKTILDNAKPLSDNLWEVNHAVAKLDTPEHKAEFAKKMLDLVETIANPNVKDFYKREYSSRIYRLGFSGQKGANNNKKATITPEIRSSLSNNNNRLDNLKERLVLVTAFNPELAMEGQVEEILLTLNLDNKVIERLAENVINFLADIEGSGVNYNGLLNYLETKGDLDQISYLRSCALKDEYIWQEGAAAKSLFAWRYLLAEYYLCLAEKEYEKLLNNDGADVSLLHEKQKEQQNNILRLSRNRDEIREEFEELLDA